LVEAVNSGDHDLQAPHEVLAARQVKAAVARLPHASVCRQYIRA
jgi:hypothetical protein